MTQNTLDIVGTFIPIRSSIDSKINGTCGCGNSDNIKNITESLVAGKKRKRGE